MDSQLPFWAKHRNALTLLANLALAETAFVLAFALRFDLSFPDRYLPVMLRLLPEAGGRGLWGAHRGAACSRRWSQMASPHGSRPVRRGSRSGRWRWTAGACATS